MSHHAARHDEGCPECGLPLCSEKCWACHGAASSWDYPCEECVAGANYCCVRVGRTTPRHCLVNKRRGETIGTIRRGKSAIHFIAGPELGFIAWPTSATPIAAEQVSHNPCVMPFTFEATNRP